MKKIKAYVVNHGHMDIEWYQPLTTYSEWFAESINMLDEIVKTEEDYKCYTYDGVVFPILYMMENDKALGEKIERLISLGKLKIGPFYTQFDEFLTSGENMIKNCLWGDRKCRELKTDAMKAGYLLDNFGHPAQLPQIFENFGIKSLFFSRGMCDIGDNVKEFLFVAPDGSSVAAQNFSYGASFKIYENNSPRPNTPNYLPYYNDSYLTYEYLTDLSKHIDHEGIAKQLIEGVKSNAKFYPSGIVPLFVGADHCPPQSGLAKTLELANEMQDEIEFIFTDAGDFSEKLSESADKLTKFSGDLLGAKFDRLFFGAMTTRAYLKRMMYDCEHMLFDYARPLAAYNSLMGGEDYKNELDEATRLLMINSTHDSVHGSSLDSVHRENEYRFDRAAQLSARVIHNSLGKIASNLGSMDGYEELVVFSPREYDGYVSAWLITNGKEIELVDREGRVYETVTAPKKEMLYNAKGQPYYLLPTGDAAREIVFRAKLSAGEVKKFYYKTKDKNVLEVESLEKNIIENEFCSLEIKDGRPIFTDKVTGEVLSGFIRFIEEAETGDSFDHSSPFADAPAFSSDEFGFKDARVTDCGLFLVLAATCTMRVPIETVGDVRSASLVDMPMCVTFKLWKGIGRLDISIKIRNYSRNHRVRAEFSFPRPFSCVKAGETFCSEDFSIDRPPMTEGWKEEHTKELPFRDWISVSDGGAGYTLAARGLYTFEPINDRTLALTLFRSVGELMRINIKSRSSCCMTGIPIEDAQCLREMTFDLSFFACGCDDSPYDIHRMTEEFIYPPAVHPSRRSAGKGDKDSSLLPFRFVDNNSFVISIFDKTYDGEHYLLRFYEMNGKSARAKIDLAQFESAALSDMNEEILCELPVRDGILELDVPANKIITVLLKKKENINDKI